MRVHPVDAVWLNTDRVHNLMVIECLMLLDGPVDRDRFERVVQQRMVERYPVFSRQPARARRRGRRPRWAQAATTFRVGDHIREVVLPPPGDESALREYVGRSLGNPLPRDRPLWEMHLVGGLAEGSAVYVRLHHALADGIALTRVLLSLTDEGQDADVAVPVAPVPAQDEPAPLPLGARLRSALPALVAPETVRSAGRTVWQTFGILGKLLATRNPDTVLAASAGAAKKVVWSEPISLSRVKDLSRQTGTTVNDVLVAVLAGALSRYQLDHDERAVDIPTMVPVNLRSLDKPLPVRLGNHFALVLLSLPSGLATPADRLAETHRRMEHIKSSPEALITFALMQVIGRTGPWVSRALVGFFARTASGVTTNVPGPREHRYLAGTRITGLLGWVPGSGNQALGTCIFTYAGTVRVGFKTDALVIPDPEQILVAFHRELEALFSAFATDDLPREAAG